MKEDPQSDLRIAAGSSVENFRELRDDSTMI